MIHHYREPICKDEHILNDRLSICKSKDKCEYLHPYNSIRYCKKFKCIRDAMIEFEREKKSMEERARNGEEYHEFDKHLSGDRLV
jgi:hypothetical protein